MVEMSHPEQADNRTGREDIAPRMRRDLLEQVRLNKRTDDRNQNGERENEPPGDTGQLTASCLQIALGFQRNPQRAMLRHGEESGDSNQDREPVQHADAFADAKVSPQGQKEVARAVERNTSDDVAVRRAIKASQQGAGTGKNDVPEGRPHGTIHFVAKLYRDSTQNQQPQHD